MTKEDEVWFEQLVKIRTYLADALELSAATGVQTSVVEKYSSEAHFIYELLQNADDVSASEAKFNLTEDGLFFTHNGTTHFTISQPDSLEDKEIEKRQKKEGKLGHINSICSIGNSSKQIESNSIGKFGVGFKSVFQYTNTPHIYDPNFRFKINRFIIPEILENDLSRRKKNETIFYFPFDKEEIPSQKAYLDIQQKLKKLVYPTLFLLNLKEVRWQTRLEKGEYTQKKEKPKQFDDIFFEKTEIFQQIESVQIKEKLYLFSRNTNEKLRNTIGFFIDEKGKLIPKQLSAFCFFPTKESTNLNFILHAPFLLTDSREGIHRSKVHNQSLVASLAKLAAQSFMILRDLKVFKDDILKIIPFKKPDSEDFFLPFYEQTKIKFENEKILPTLYSYEERQNAYWAQDNSVLNLFNDEQLSVLINNKNAKWVFRSFVRNQTTKDDWLRKYIDECTSKSFELSELLNKIDANFIESQTDQWLNKFYDFLARNNSYWENIKTKPIFLNTYRNAVCAFEKRGFDYHEILFLPSENFKSASKTIFPEFLLDTKTKEFIEKFGIKKPNLKDEIFNIILPEYEKNEALDTEPHFSIFFKYWLDEGRPEEFINLIKDKEFIVYRSKNNPTTYRGKACEIYYPTPELVSFFEHLQNTYFLDLEFYNDYINDLNKQKDFKDFLCKLGLNFKPIVKKEVYVDDDIIYDINSFDNVVDLTNVYTRRGRFTLKMICYNFEGLNKNDGFFDTKTNFNRKKSFLLWNDILPLLKSYYLDSIEYATSRHETKKKEFVSSIGLFGMLNKTKWLLNKQNQWVTPSEITKLELADGYISNIEIENLLNFKPLVILTESERIAQKFENEEEAELAKNLLENYKASKIKNSLNKVSSSDVLSTEKTKSHKILKAINDLDDLQNEFPSKLNENKNLKTKSELLFDENEEFAKGIEDLKNQLEIKKNRVDLADKINNSIKYSYDWFKSYLKLLTTYAEKQVNQKQKSISFQEIKPIKSDNKYFLLCGGSNYISPEIENANDFIVSLVFGNGKKENIIVEGVSKKGQDLLIYCREPLTNNSLSRLSNIFKVEINFTPMIDLLDKLEKAFENENYIDRWKDIELEMPSLNYIYGPPGTGKTTTLCNKINEVLSSNSNARFLVLTPTNKASDVVCKKLLDINSDINAVRLSSPTDPELEECQIYRDTLNEDDLQIVDVVALTIHRLPYFDIQEVGLLFQCKWDYVIFDESSMTGLHYITFAIMAIFKTNPNTNFIIAGDPKQIPPVIEITDKELESFDFQDENIYKMMSLESFNPDKQKIREIDSIENLKTQYRSIPEIGQLFSELSYSGLLNHDRAYNRKETKHLPKEFKKLISSNVTFVDIPLNQEDSIYKVNKLFYSSYHTYCAILVLEIIKYFESTSKAEQWTIGLIAPYKAQAVLLNKLITSYGISENVKVYSDTVHGFQGDECDIIFFICNPNNYFYSGHEKALLSKEYIYNVAISRAKDFLIILHPYTTISNPFINKISNSYKTNFGNTKILKASEFEELIFKDKNYIENNSYVSGHDNVNVFGLSEMKYFIKANDTAIDIQLRDLNDLKN